MKISEVIRKGADECLHPTRSGEPASMPYGIWPYSCNAVAEAENGHNYNGSVCNDDSKAVQFLLTLGNVPKWGAFNEFPEGPERQGALFLWLHFAALVAEDYENGVIEL